MGTRSTVKFFDKYSDEPVLSVYNQFDGYISGTGYQLAEWLKKKKIINGIRHEKMEDGYANGMGCLAAQYVKENKNRIGGFYLTTMNDSQGYDYEVRIKDNGFIIKVSDVFEGTPDELLAFNESE